LPSLIWVKRLTPKPNAASASSTRDAALPLTRPQHLRTLIASPRSDLGRALSVTPGGSFDPRQNTS
jgi:hypothetical protein